MMQLCTVAGYVGVAMALAATFAVQVGMLKGDGWAFPTCTLIVCTLISVSLIPQWNAPVAISEVLYAVSGVVGLTRYFLRRRTRVRWLSL